jgi:hypothetical protein
MTPLISPTRSNPKAYSMLDDLRESRKEEGVRYIAQNFAALRNTQHSTRRIAKGT